MNLFLVNIFYSAEGVPGNIKNIMMKDRGVVHGNPYWPTGYRSRNSKFADGQLVLQDVSPFKQNTASL